LNRRQFIGLTLAAGLAASYPVLTERYMVRVNRYRIHVPRLPAAFAGLTVAHLTDLHLGLLQPLALLERLVERVNALGVDLIVCTGDYVHERNGTAQIDTIWPLLARLSSPLGVYSVLGNHDHWADTNRSLAWLERTGQGIRGRAVPLERGGARLWLAGAGDQWEDPLSLDDILEDVPEEDCRIVLAHNPDTADTPHSARVDLMLSGHTHGGQVEIPFIGAPIVPVENKSYTRGLVRSRKGELIFISRGIGWAVLPLRFNCPPEVALLELVPAGQL